MDNRYTGLSLRKFVFLTTSLTLIFLFQSWSVFAQCVSLTTLGSASTQSFNTLSSTAGSTTNNLTITGWFMTESGGGARDNEQYAVDNGASATGDTYSYGTVAGDRALGALRSGTLIPIFGSCYTNNTGSTIASISIAYTGEQWRLGTAGRTDQLNFEMSTNATSLTTGTWTSYSSLDFVTPNTTGAVSGAMGARDGNAMGFNTALTYTITGLSIANGATFWIRWNDVDASGADDGLAIDDFSLTPNAPVVSNLSINDVSLLEGNAGTTSFTYTVSLSTPAGPGGVTFDIATADNTATTAGNDYTAKSLTGQTIPAGSSTYSFTVLVNGDTDIEFNETFFVNITNVTGATVTDGQGEGSIINDDTCPTLNITVAEGSGDVPNDGNICLGESATLTASGGGTYAWSTGANTTSITVAPNITTLYTVTVTNEGSCVGTDTLTIHVDPKPQFFTVTGGGSYCGVGSGVEIGLSGSEATARYFLYRNNLYVNDIPGTGSALSFGSFTQTGTYVIVGSYTSTGCFNLMTGTAVINTNGPSFTAIPTNGACPESNPFVTLDVPGDTGYKYDISTGATYTGSMTAAAGGTTINEDPLEAYNFPTTPSPTGTQYTVRVIDVATGCYSDQTFTVSGIPENCDCEAPPFVNFTPLNITSCDVNIVTIGYTVVNGPATVSTTGLAGTLSTTTLNDGTGTFTYTPAPGEVGFSVDIFGSIADPDEDGPCEGDTAIVTINLVPYPNPTIVVSNEFSGLAANDGIICEGSSATLTANEGGTYLWSTGATTSSIVVSPNTTTTYTVTVTTGPDCFAEVSQVITVNPLPTPSIIVVENSGIADDGTICAGASAELSTFGAETYAWSTGENTPSITVAPSITTTYTLTVTVDGCVGIATQVITVNPLPTPSITVTESSGTTPNDGTICQGATATLSTSGGGTYLWSTGATSSSINVAPNINTTYTVTVTNNGCSGTAQRVITVNPPPNPSITVSENSGTPDDGNICASTSTTLTASGGGTYIWSTGASTSSITVAPVITTTYTVTVTTNGCSASTSQVITVTPPVEPTFTQLGPYCANGNQYLLPATSLNGISGTWSPSIISTNTAATTRYVFTPSGGACADTASMNIVVNPSPDAPELADITVCEGESTNIEITTSGGLGDPQALTITYGFDGETKVAVIAGAGASGATASPAAIGSGLTTESFPSGTAPTAVDAYSAANWTQTAAIDANDYFEFCVTATANHVLDFSNFRFDAQRSGTGAMTYQIAVSVNGGAFTNVGAAGSVATSFSAHSQALAVSNASSVCIRIYGYSSTGTAGTFRVDNVVLTGSSRAMIFTQYNFYAVDPAANPSAEPVATGTSYDPGTTPASSPDTVWVTCIGSNGCESPATEVIVRVIETPSLAITQPAAVCEPETVDVTEVDLGESPSGGTVSYHTTQADAENDANPINTGLDAVSSSATFFVRYEVESGCFAIGQINVVINPPADAPELPDSIVVCVGGSTNVQLDTIKTNTFTWDFEGNITKAGVSENTAVAAHPAVQTAGAGLTGVAYQTAGSGCSDAVTSTGYDVTNASLADAVTDNEYFEFCTGTTNPGYTYLGLSRIEWGNRASGTGPINYAVVASGNLTTPLLTGVITGTSCQIEGGALAALNTGTCFRIYFWGATAGAGTLRIDNMEITANYKPEVTYRFYDVDPATNPTAEPIAEGSSYNPETTLGSSPDTLWVTCVNNTFCESEAVRVIVKVVDCSVSITDPCTCTGPIEQIENGTYTNNGKFTETVAVTAPSGQTWTVAAVTGLYTDAALTTPIAVGTALVETPANSGNYILQGYHQDSVGYTISVTNGNITLDTSNVCYYPDPSFSGIPPVVTTSSAPFNVLGVGANSVAGTGTFYVNNVQVGTGPTPTQVSIDPADLIVGENTIVFQFDAGYASPQSLLDPGCSKQVRQSFIVYEDKCSCMAVNVSLDANCQFRLLPTIISPNCVTGTVRVMDNDPSNGDIIDCPGVWTYGLFDTEGKLICWGQVTAEDKTPPAIVCTDWYQGTLDCYDIDFVLNNHQTIGNVGATSSPRPSPGSTQTIANAEGITGTGNCNLVPPNLVADNINNLGYTYFADNCRDCGCRTTVKWSDKVVYYSCEQMRTNGGLYAKIYRTWNATDCKGMRRDTVQEIPFARPALEDFVFNGDGEGKYDRVVTYSSCTPDKELIQKSDVTPFVCSYFNRTAAPRFSRCLYIDEVECNYSVSIKDTEFPVCGGKGLKIDRELYVFDWCAGGIVDTFHILIKIGDFDAPYLEYAHHAPFDVSTGPMDCTAAIPVSVAGIKSQFGVTVTDLCALGNVSVKVKTKDRYVKGILVAEDVWDKIDYAVMNGMMIGLPVGRHRMIIDASDGCYNALRDSFEFEVKDKIAPVMKCDDDLHVTLSNANGYTSGYAQVSVDDIDEGSWDNCKLAWIAARRNVPDACVASFIAKGYDTNGNGKLDALPADGDYTKADGFDLNGDGDIADFGETFILKGGKLMTPLADFVEFFCCDLTERVTVELWGEDIYGNTNYCWMDLLIEDKVAPTCIAPWDQTIYCDDKNIAQIDDKIASGKIFGDITIPTGNDCAALDTVYSTVKSLKCGYGYIDRIWTLTKQTAKGPISITCKQRINILPVHEYNICFPKDVSTDCKTPVIDTVLTDELACDILAVNVSDKRYDASDDECYKIFRTYTVINWCVYDDRCGDPMAEGNVYVVDRATFGNYGKNPLYVLVRDREGNVRDGNEEFYLSKDLIAANADDIRFTPPICYPEGPKFTESNLIPVQGEYYHSFMYTQIIKVYDDVRPVVEGLSDTFCIRDGIDCLANIKMVVSATDNCTDKIELETQYLMIAPNQTTDAGKMILYSTPRWSTKDLGNGQFEINVANLPEGTHDLIVVVRDECGNLSVATRIPFTVKDCKGPAPICINGLGTELMPDGNGGGMMTVWATDFIASKIYDCNGQGPETKDGLKLVTKYSINRLNQPVIPTQTSITVNCADKNRLVVVEIHAWDEKGNHDFCLTYVEVQDGRKICPGSATETVNIAGTIATEGNANLQGASVTLSGAASQSATTPANGAYSFINLATGGDFTVTPQLDKNHLNGVSTFDLVLIQKHILGVQALNSPYKMIAADVNNSKSISTLDLIALRKLILNIDSHFANNTSWRFIDASYHFPNASNPWSAAFPEVVSINDIANNTTANFIAIKVGDVNASASVSSAASAEIRTSGYFELKTGEKNLKAGNEYKVTFNAEDLKNIQGYQFALNLDQSKVELLDIEYGVAKAENFGVFKSEGLITTSWNAKYEAGALFTLVLRAKADGKLSQSLNLNRLVHPEAYDQNSENLGIKLAFEGEQISDSYELKQNTPNPFGNETNIGFTLPKATKAMLTIRDVKGALIYKVEGNYTKGNNQVTLKKEQLGASGVLYYTLETNDFTATRKMIILQ